MAENGETLIFIRIFVCLYYIRKSEGKPKDFFQQVVQHKPGVGSSDIKNVPRTKVGTIFDPHIEVSSVLNLDKIKRMGFRFFAELSCTFRLRLTPCGLNLRRKGRMFRQSNTEQKSRNSQTVPPY